jgi:7,8-dihydro-6-hydroxymethylpterin-pyrophosphokinase
MTTLQKAFDLKRKHGVNSIVQAQQIIALIPFSDSEKRNYWNKVLELITKEFDPK